MQTLAIILLALYALSFVIVAVDGVDDIDWPKVITHFAAGVQRGSADLCLTPGTAQDRTQTYMRAV